MKLRRLLSHAGNVPAAACWTLGVCTHLWQINQAAVQEEEQTVARTLAGPRSCLRHIPARVARRAQHCQCCE